MKHYTIESKRQVTQQEVDDVVTTALEGGITYWCDAAETDYDLGDGYLSEVLTRGGDIKLHDAEDDKWYTLTLDAFIRALGVCMFDFEQYDALDADNVVQTAIFGEVIYG